ncbi:hypothetical protein [Kineosporia sp. A_224]|uniref:hypothetical protein n=1 Tax=Kineosporia sp. A_224 TaxID=1962180 RepID=UPI000B4B9B0E|nr:hypothetical protein [Kineosporia sp. A_224]
MTTTSTALRPDRWFTTDRPLLLAVAAALDETPTVIVHAVEVPGVDDPEERVRAGLRLLRGGYLEGDDGVGYAIVSALTERGMREVGEWPTADTLARRVLDELAAAADEAPDEPTRSRLRTAIEVLSRGTLDTATNVLGVAIAKAMGLTP